MIGNDIIDIEETRSTTDWEKPRFLQKICSATEQKIIRASDHPFLTVWQFWSMKESAYKVYIQAGGERFFNPSKIECRLSNFEIGEVKIGTMTLHTTTKINSAYIFTTATVNATPIKSEVFELTAVDQKHQSRFMHNQITTDFAKHHGLLASALTLKKTTAGVPLFSYKNKPLQAALSLSHHGLYGAYSFAEAL